MIPLVLYRNDQKSFWSQIISIRVTTVIAFFRNVVLFLQDKSKGKDVTSHLIYRA